MTMISRTVRAGIVAALAILISGCVSSERIAEMPLGLLSEISDPAGSGTAFEDEAVFGSPFVSAYAEMEDDGYRIPAVPISKMDPKYLRQRVPYDAGEYEPGTVIVDTANRFLYVIEAGGMAMRYGIGVGGDGFSWSGEARVGAKKHWPKWYPPAEMIEREPRLAPYADGMDPGLQNPLGARALYLFQDGRDTLYRLHGTPEWWSIGTAASSGCIRLTNQDIIDLYERVEMGARVVVLQGNEQFVAEAETEAPQELAASAEPEAFVASADPQEFALDAEF